MARVELPLRCLAVRVVFDKPGEIDGIELEAFLNEVAGRHQWLSTTEWLFVDPPPETGDWPTVPVVMPEEVAVRAILEDLTGDPPRILFDHQTTPAERRKWRWVAFQVSPNRQGRGYFPWERVHA